MTRIQPIVSFFFFNDTATTEIYTLSLHDALPIWDGGHGELDPVVPLDQRERLGDQRQHPQPEQVHLEDVERHHGVDRKSTRLNSSHLVISYAVFCLKKKKNYVNIHSNARPVARVL